ncbi:NAD(P)-binding domain-containing protein [Actinokineospora sp. HUAS TT18]|uniref:NAD(P)-binding domain-containing protein n=1 Tax=Actinokineospora sp. HUAS TT18 TaxID=3447451 RepID=UPI003F51C791
MFAVDTVVIGAGQAGLAVSRCLADNGVDHVVLERGQIGQRWRGERWDSLRLINPNWATRLPGWGYRGDDPDGYMTAVEFADYLQDYAASFGAPVHSGAAVTRVEGHGGGFAVHTEVGGWRASSVVIASGWCDRPHVPAMAAGLSPSVFQLTPGAYRNPGQLPEGGVLVVGASASGVQLADELARSGREVTLAVGRHRRLPRHHEGRDIWHALIGTFGVTIDQVANPAAARAAASMQLIGRKQAGVDLPTLQGIGVRLTGRLTGVDGTRVRFADDLAVTTGHAEVQLIRLLRRIGGHSVPLESVMATDVDHLDLRRAGITTVIWATGFRRHYPWLRVPALGPDGEIRQRRGVTPVPGLYVMGQRFQHRRDSDFVDGVRHDAVAVAEHLTRDRRDLPA